MNCRPAVHVNTQDVLDDDSSPPNICADLLSQLFGDKAVRQVLLERCNGDAAALAAELMAKGLTAKQVSFRFRLAGWHAGASNAAPPSRLPPRSAGRSGAGGCGYVVGEKGEIELIDSEASYDSDCD
jgi:hypothetical protein